jgi:hypothetical protein
MMLDGFHKELREFDRSRILLAWDGLVAKQQVALESHAVPTMAETTVPSEREVRRNNKDLGVDSDRSRIATAASDPSIRRNSGVEPHYSNIEFIIVPE